MNELTTTNGYRSLIEAAALNPNFNADKLAIVLDRQQQWEDRQALKAFNRDFAEVQRTLDAVAKTGVNPTFKSTYPTLYALWTVAKPILSANGFSVRFGRVPNPHDGWMTIVCILSHEQGHSETHPWDGPYDQSSRAKTGIQTVGSTATYLRRYSLMAALNLVAKDDETDDDGESERRAKQEDTLADEIEAFRKRYVSDIAVAEQSLSTAARLGTEAFRTQWKGTMGRICWYFMQDHEQMEAWQATARQADERATHGQDGSGHESGERDASVSGTEHSKQT
jgi:hypothetical protein